MDEDALLRRFVLWEIRDEEGSDIASSSDEESESSGGGSDDDEESTDGGNDALSDEGVEGTDVAPPKGPKPRRVSKRRVRDTRRRTYTNAFKLMIVQKAKEGIGSVRLAALYGIRCHSSISAWKKNEGKLIEACKNRKARSPSVARDARQCSSTRTR
jgi:transposase-like protein